MKPFNLELAKAGHPVCARNGNDVRIVCFDGKHSDPIIGILNESNGAELFEELECWKENGKYLDLDTESCKDLFMKENPCQPLTPFNLELAKAGHAVCTREGKDVRILCVDRKGIYPVGGLIDENERDDFASWKLDGSFLESRSPHRRDLFMKEEEKKTSLLPFNLGLAKAGHPVCTVSGLEVCIISFKGALAFPIIGVIKAPGHEYYYCWNDRGYFCNDIDGPLNLRMSDKR